MESIVERRTAPLAAGSLTAWRRGRPAVSIGPAITLPAGVLVIALIASSTDAAVK